MRTIVACLMMVYEFNRIMAYINRQPSWKRWSR